MKLDETLQSDIRKKLEEELDKNLKDYILLKIKEEKEKKVFSNIANSNPLPSLETLDNNKEENNIFNGRVNSEKEKDNSLVTYIKFNDDDSYEVSTISKDEFFKLKDEKKIFSLVDWDNEIKSLTQLNDIDSIINKVTNKAIDNLKDTLSDMLKKESDEEMNIDFDIPNVFEEKSDDKEEEMNIDFDIPNVSEEKSDDKEEEMNIDFDIPNVSEEKSDEIVNDGDLPVFAFDNFEVSKDEARLINKEITLYNKDVNFKAFPIDEKNISDRDLKNVLSILEERGVLKEFRDKLNIYMSKHDSENNLSIENKNVIDVEIENITNENTLVQSPEAAYQLIKKTIEEDKFNNEVVSQQEARNLISQQNQITM